MANVGLKRFFYAKLKEDNKTYEVTDGKLKTIEGPIECKPKYNFNEAELYAGNRLKEKATEFSKGDLTLGIDDDYDDAFNGILGREETEGEYPEAISNVSDVAPYVGFAQIINKRIDNVPMYKGEFLPKVQFKPFTTDSKTKGNSLEFTNPSVEGNFYENADGVYERHKTFKTYDEAENYIKECFGIQTTTQISQENE